MRTAHVITASAFLALGVPSSVFANDAKHDVNSTVTFHPGEHKVKDLVAATKERIERLLGLVEACAPVNVDRAITVYDVKHVNVTKLASVVDSVMELWRLQPLVGAKVTSRRPATIHLVPDPRSRKLIIEASSKAVLTEVERLIRALDRKPTTTFPAIRPESSETATGVTTSKSTTLLRVEPSSDGIRGHRVDISSGDIPIDEFLRFVADCEGLAVIREAGAGAGGKDTIHVAAPIKNADFEIVKAILDANGWALETRELDNGRKVIRVRRRASPKVGSFHPPRIIRATKDGKVTDSK